MKKVISPYLQARPRLGHILGRSYILVQHQSPQLQRELPGFHFGELHRHVLVRT
jgi:hypothetical protein